MEFGEMAHYEDFGIFANFRYLRFFRKRRLLEKRLVRFAKNDYICTRKMAGNRAWFSQKPDSERIDSSFANFLRMVLN